MTGAKGRVPVPRAGVLRSGSPWERSQEVFHRAYPDRGRKATLAVVPGLYRPAASVVAVVDE